MRGSIATYGRREQTWEAPLDRAFARIVELTDRLAALESAFTVFSLTVAFPPLIFNTRSDGVQLNSGVLLVGSQVDGFTPYAAELAARLVDLNAPQVDTSDARAVGAVISDLAAALNLFPDTAFAVDPATMLDVTLNRMLTVVDMLQPVVSPTPAPTFTSQPSISPPSGTAGQTFTAIDAVLSDGSAPTRRWLLSGNAIGTDTAVIPNTAGSLVLENTAPDGVTTVVSTAAAVAAAPPPATPSVFGSGIWNDTAAWSDTDTWKDVA